MPARKEILIRARDIIAEQEHLAWRAYRDADGCYCAVGAIGTAAGVDDFRLTGKPILEVAEEEIVAVANAVRERTYTIADSWLALDEITLVNDNDGKDAVLAAFDTAIKEST